MENTNKPVKKFVVAPISVAIWEQTNEKDGKKFTTNSLTIQRTYKDKEGNYQNTQNIRVQDVAKLQLALNEAYKSLVVTQLEEANE